MKVPITRERLWNDLKSHGVAPVYVLFGAETHLRDLAAKAITDRAFAAGDFRDFNDNEFSLNTPDNIKSALAAAEQLPMMASRRVIRITEVKVSTSGMKDTLKEEYESILSTYLARPAETSVVIFIADELNGVRKIGKLLRDKSVAVEFKKLDDLALSKWARNTLKDLGSVMDERTMRHLIALVGPDVRRLTNEVEKLSTAALPGNVIDSDLVDSLVANVRETSSFDLTDCLVARNKPKALQILAKVLDDGSEPLALLGLISYNFRRLLIAKYMMENGAERTEVARVVKLRYNDQEPFLAAARRAEMKTLTTAIRRLSETDLAIKTSIGGGGPKGSRIQIELLVCELAAG